METKRNLAMWWLGMLTILASATGTVYATFGSVPEVNASSLSAGLGLLAGAVMILRARMHRKR